MEGTGFTLIGPASPEQMSAPTLWTNPPKSWGRCRGGASLHQTVVYAEESLFRMFLSHVLYIRTVSLASCLHWELFGKARGKLASKCHLGYLVPTARLALELPRKFSRNRNYGD